MANVLVRIVTADATRRELVGRGDADIANQLTASDMQALSKDSSVDATPRYGARNLSLVMDVYGPLASTAAIHFGDLPDPMSGERAESNLEGATQMIEILALLAEKTRGNLTAEERQVLEQVLYELRLRFVEAKNGARRIVEP